jgi:hypothetical protein
MHAYVGTSNSAAGALSVEAARSARYAGSVEVAAYASTIDSAASSSSLRSVSVSWG